MLQIWVVHTHLSTHFSQFSNHYFRAAVACIGHVLPIAGTAKQQRHPRYLPAHIAKRIPRQCCHVKTAGIIDVNRRRCYFKNIIVKTEYVFIRPVTQASIFWQAVSANARAREYDIAVRGTNFDCLNDLNQVHAVALGEQTPLVKKRKYRRPIGIFDNLCGFRFNRPVHNRQRIFFGIQHLSQKFLDAFSCFSITAGTDPPKIPYRCDILFAGHNPFEAVRQQRRRIYAAYCKGLFHNRPGHKLRCARRHCCLDQRQTPRRNFCTNRFHCSL